MGRCVSAGPYGVPPAPGRRPCTGCCAGPARPGSTGVPEVLGTDARGREILTYLPGTILDVDEDLMTDGQLVATARWLRRAARGAGRRRPRRPWRWFDVPDATVLGHNDVAPYNLCFEGDTLTGVFDWDLAGPTTPALELAQLAWSGVPLYRARPADEVARRLDLLATTYGGPSAREVLDAVRAAQGDRHRGDPRLDRGR